MNNNRVLIIAAHPDDDILGCGGYISKHRKTMQFKVIFIAEGSTSRFNDPSSKEAISAISNRQEIAIKALELLDVIDVEFNNLPCGRLDQIPQLEINKIIERAIDDFRPDIIFTHSQTDLNQDHSSINKSTIIATRPKVKNNVGAVFAYEVLSSTEWNFGKCFLPNFFEEISHEDLKAKKTAMMLYTTEVSDYPFPRSDSGIEVLAMYRGMQSGVNLAEAFQVVRILK